MPPKWNHVTNSYDNISAAAMKKVVLPEKIKCFRCNRYKAPTNYSNKQLADIKFWIYKDGRVGNHQPKCRACTGQQVTELRCYMCGQDKGLEGFAKAQRRRPDHAKCWECMNEQLALEPEGDALDDDDDDDVEDDDDGFDDFDSYPVMASSAASDTGIENLSIDDSASQSGSTTSYGAGQSSTAGSLLDFSNYPGSPGGVALANSIADEDERYPAQWEGVQVGRRRVPGSSNLPASSQNSTTGGSSMQRSSANNSFLGTTFDPTKYGYNRRRIPSSSESVVSSKSFSSNTTATNNDNKKWAKIRAYKEKDDYPKPVEDEEEEDDDWKTQTQGGSDEDDDDEDDEDDEDDDGPYRH